MNAPLLHWGLGKQWEFPQVGRVEGPRRQQREPVEGTQAGQNRVVPAKGAQKPGKEIAAEMDRESRTRQGGVMGAGRDPQQREAGRGSGGRELEGLQRVDILGAPVWGTGRRGKGDGGSGPAGRDFPLSHSYQ